MKRVLVTGCGGPAGVNFIKSLRHAPEKFFIVGTDTNKYHIEWPDLDERYIVPECTNPNYIDGLNKVIKKERIEFLHPQPDIEVRIISENREEIEAITFLPKKKTIRICQDKFLSANEWKKHGIPSVKAIKLRDDHLEKDLEKAFNEFGDTIWIRAKKGAGGKGSTPASNIETAIHWIKYWRSRGKDWEFIAQEYLPGKNIAFQSVWKDGEIVTSQARERLEYIYPHLAPSGITGTPSVAVTIHREDVNEVATKAVLAIDKEATGVFCVDLKENKEGEPVPTEINAGRFFTTSFFFTKAGVNMPYIYVKLAYKEKIPEVKKYNALPAGLYWIRHIDAGHLLMREGEWRSKEIK